MPDPANPDDPGVWFTAAIEYTHNQDYTNALRCFEKATELNPDFIDVWGRMGLLLVKLGRFEEARACDAHIPGTQCPGIRGKPQASRSCGDHQPVNRGSDVFRKAVKIHMGCHSSIRGVSGMGTGLQWRGVWKGVAHPCRAFLFCSSGTVLTVLEGTVPVIAGRAVPLRSSAAVASPPGPCMARHHCGCCLHFQKHK